MLLRMLPSPSIFNHYAMIYFKKPENVLPLEGMLRTMIPGAPKTVMMFLVHVATGDGMMSMIRAATRNRVDVYHLLLLLDVMGKEIVFMTADS